MRPIRIAAQIHPQQGTWAALRAAAIAADVPVVPGTDGPVTSAEQAVAFVEEAGLPVIIKAAMGFRGFSLRGKEKVSGEWTLVCLAYNLKRLHIVGANLRTA